MANNRPSVFNNSSPNPVGGVSLLHVQRHLDTTKPARYQHAELYRDLSLAIQHQDWSKFARLATVRDLPDGNGTARFRLSVNIKFLPLESLGISQSLDEALVNKVENDTLNLTKVEVTQPSWGEWAKQLVSGGDNSTKFTISVPRHSEAHILLNQLVAQTKDITTEMPSLSGR